MALVSVSLVDAAWIAGCVGVLLIEWNVAASVPVGLQAEYFMYIAAWIFLTTTFSLLPLSQKLFKGESFTFKACTVSTCTQLIVWAMGLALCWKIFGAGADAGSKDSAASFDAWFRSGSDAPGMFLERQAHLLLLANMFRDFILADPLSGAFVLHHVLAILGTGLVLVLPVGFGAATLNSVQAEACSMLFNLMFIMPVSSGGNKAVAIFFQYLYLVGMMLSHIAALGIGYFHAFEFVDPSASPGGPWWTWWRVLYTIICVLIVVFRVIGMVLYGKKIFGTEWIPVMDSEDCKAD
eukprot:TRINITY_DN50106_c0_g1_i1.p1 TRINITY_DN50106_c0_g1~~TRINITY_DN50106_c0_g1_i1.p1  ORF type:complete len:294 (-),score=44.65 TRINITY_DN50106_c0_g1_i1:330-1211(-)